MNVRFGPGPPPPARPSQLARQLDAFSHGLTTALCCWALIGAML